MSVNSDLHHWQIMREDLLNKMRYKFGIWISDILLEISELHDSRTSYKTGKYLPGKHTVSPLMWRETRRSIFLFVLSKTDSST